MSQYVQVAGSNGQYFIAEITNKSGHFMPSASSLTTAANSFAQNGFVILPGAIVPFKP